MDSYFSLLNLSFVENYHMIIFTAFAKQSMINRLSNPINRNRSAAKISKVMSSNRYRYIHRLEGTTQWRMLWKKCKMKCTTIFKVPHRLAQGAVKYIVHYNFQRTTQVSPRGGAGHYLTLSAAWWSCPTAWNTSLSHECTVLL